MTYLLSIDPGMSTGIVFGQFEPTTPYERLGFWLVEGGLAGFLSWLWARYNPDDSGWWKVRVFDPGIDPYELQTMVKVCEKFVPLQSDRTFRVDELEPIRIEGALEILLGEEPIWQRSAAMVLSQVGVRDTMTARQKAAARKKASDNVLREAGLWLTGKQVGCKDANDVNAAQKHAIAYLRSIKHKPTVELLIQEDE